MGIIMHLLSKLFCLFVYVETVGGLKMVLGRKASAQIIKDTETKLFLVFGLLQENLHFSSFYIVSNLVLRNIC